MELQERLEFSNYENVKLLNGMHEGLTILSDKNVTGNQVLEDQSTTKRKLLFSNMPAQKLFRFFLGSLGDDKATDP